MSNRLPPKVVARLGELAKTIDDAEQERQDLIVEGFVTHSASFREIARASGLTHTGVRKMLGRLGHDDQSWRDL